MDNAIYIIVEGDGEVTAAPELIRRLLYEQFQRFDLEIRRPYSAHGGGNLDTEGRLEKFLELARRAPDCIGVIVLRDAERVFQHCPPELACSLARRTLALKLPFPVVVVCPNCEYESWFIVSLEAIKPYLKNADDLNYIGDPEQECGAKGWLTRHMPDQRVYKETSDQVRFTKVLDISHTLKHSRSFRRMVHAVEELLGAIDSHTTIVTPVASEEKPGI